MGRTLQMESAEVFLPLFQPSRYKGAFGGRGSGKSHHFARMLVRDHIANRGLRSVCVREVQRTLENSVKRLLDDVIAQHQLQGEFDSQKSSIHTPGDGVIIFQGMQDTTADNIKSLEGFDRAWVEEAQTLSQRSLDLLRPTIRKPGSELWFSWNPRDEKDPIDKFLRQSPPPDAVVVRANYEDNPWFPEELRREMEFDRSRDPEKYAHVWLGEYERNSEKRVFRNWRIEDFETPVGAVLYYGADWGFAADPTVLVRCWIEGRTLYVDREVYRIGCEIEDTPALFDTLDQGYARRWVITADSARPETISHIRNHGYPLIKAAKKGPNSVEEGVKFLQSYDIVVHPRCKHVVDELTLYSYKVDKRDERIVLPILDDKHNHCIDALRYATEAARRGGARAVALPVVEQPSAWAGFGESGVAIDVNEMDALEREQVGRETGPYRMGRR